MASRPWTFDDIPAEWKATGGHLMPENAQVGANNQISTVADAWGGVEFAHPTSSSQVFLGNRFGFPCFVWPDTNSSRRLIAASNIAPVWWMIVAAYKDGTAETFSNYHAFFGFSTSQRVLGAINSSDLFTNVVNSWAQTISKNAGPQTSTVLPMPLSLVETEGPAISARWALGGTEANRAWAGPMFKVIWNAVAPDADLRARIQGRLAWDYGIQDRLPANHPYRAAPPMVVTAEVIEARGGAVLPLPRAGGAAGVTVAARGSAGLRLGAGGGVAVSIGARGGAVAAMKTGGDISVNIGAKGGARVSLAVQGALGMQIGAGGGAMARLLAGGSLLVADALIIVRGRVATAGQSRTGARGPQGQRFTAGNDGRRITRAP